MKRLLLMSLLIFGPADAVPLRPYEVLYDTRALGLSMTLKRSLSSSDDGFVLRNKGKNVLISIDETARFSIQDGKILGQQYKSKRRTLLTQRREIIYLPKDKLIRSRKDKIWTELPWQINLLDSLLQQEQLRITLLTSKSPPPTLDFRVIDGDKVNKKKWEFVAVETIETLLGPLEAVHYRAIHKNPGKRRSNIWLCPNLDYLMIKTEHEERGTPIIAVIKDINFAVD